MKPKVSIVIPVYNGSNFLAEAIESALAQTWRPMEIIVVNDGSDDQGATEKIALSYGDRLRYLSQENQGAPSALNAGILAMTGDYFSWLSHDDLYAPNKIDAQMDTVRAFKKSPRPPVVYSNWIQIDGSGRELMKITLPEVPPEKMALYFFSDRSMHGCSILAPREAFEKVGMFDASLMAVCDYDLWLRMCQEYPFVLRPEFLVKGRYHANQASHTYRGFTQEKERFYLKFAPTIDLTGLWDKSLEFQVDYAFKTAGKMIMDGCPWGLAAWMERLLRFCPVGSASLVSGALCLAALEADQGKAKIMAQAFRAGLKEMLEAAKAANPDGRPSAKPGD